MDSDNVHVYVQLFTVILTAAVTMFNYPDVDPNLRPINVPTSELLPEYDFIIVGSGSAGSPLANRLTEIPEWKVLLLEAGGDETAMTDTPMLNLFNRGTNVDWNYTTVPQKHVCRASQGICTLSRGRVIGGSSTLNDFVWQRGNRLDYDGWAAQGNVGWSYRDVLPYFLRLENITDPSVIDSPFHGHGGPITIGRSPYLTQMVPHYLAALAEVGLQQTDLEGENQIGSQIERGPIIDGLRCSTGRGYLRPIRNRTNLHVAENAFVTKINIDPTTKTAQGVTFTRYGQVVQVKASKEVILSAGAVNSPQLLMLSGIGPAEHLQELGIPLIQNLRVGDNGQDHVYALTPMTQSAPDDLTVETVFNLTNLFQFVQNGTGPLTSLNAEVAADFYNEEPPYIPGLPDARCDLGSFYPTTLNSQVFYMTTYYFRPTSRGTVRLASTDPTVQPLIDPKFLTTEFDRKQALLAMRMPFRLMATNAFQQIGVKFAQNAAPLCPFNGNVTDEFAECLIENYSLNPLNFCCTCKMGPSSDSEAVVDPRLRVHGVKGLRVIDGSIIPSMPTADPAAPTIMIGERASDLIREDYGQPIGRIPPIPSSVY